ncbi:hypothetical protein BN2497_5937 [Janthinobacterium sp. CG23_2]|nr:hypothetical protein BN2497_5663 [Janthinobacterium sp. CG23_2]CUI05580.1 hypothetical protein BN2497_5937 [Janthinobacterium sp. CG23_2]CUU29229.1 hypothetical protein BN3177_5663 [Janthinobacterium sp. CG23_2]CUU29366.1 hypothetical protein BN3177_5937 [Janthinobacterium sp. CG23_2]
MRMPKVKQKILECFRHVTDGDNFCTIRSICGIVCKQEHGMLEVLRSAFADGPIRPTA